MISAAQAFAACDLWRASWFQTDRRPIPQWLAENVSLVGDFARKGPFITSPWMNDLYADLQNPLVRRVHCRKANQTGGTLIPIGYLMWSIVENPIPALWAQQTEDMMEKQLEKRILPVMERGCPKVKALLPDTAAQDKMRRAGKTRKKRMNFYFPAASVSFGAANLSTLQSDGYALIVADEIWLPVWKEMWVHAVARTLAYEAKGETKIYSSSQAGVQDDLEDTVFKSGQQAYLYFRCPACEGSTPLAFNPAHWNIGLQRADGVKTGLVWDENAKNKDGYFNVELAKSTARYRCHCCLHEMKDLPAVRRRMEATQHFISANPEAPVEFRSYHIESLVYRSFALLVAEFCTAHNAYRRGVTGPRVAFRQKQQALPSLEGAVEPVDLLRSQVEKYHYRDYAKGVKWDGEASRCMGVDRQKKGFWVEIMAWRANGESRQLFYGWVERKEEVFLLQDEYQIPKYCVMEDCGFDRTGVFNDHIQFGWIPMRGEAPKLWAHPDKRLRFWSPPDFVRYQDKDIPVIWFSAHDAKDLLHNRLAGRGQYHGVPLDVSELWRRQIDAEIQRESKTGKVLWQKITDGADNHANDTGAMCITYALIQGYIQVDTEPSP